MSLLLQAIFKDMYLKDDIVKKYMGMLPFAPVPSYNNFTFLYLILYLFHLNHYYKCFFHIIMSVLP